MELHLRLGGLRRHFEGGLTPPPKPKPSSSYVPDTITVMERGTTKARGARAPSLFRVREAHNVVGPSLFMRKHFNC